MPEKISHHEFKKAMNELYSKMPESKRNKVKLAFGGQLDDSSVETGISRREFDAQMRYFENNPSHGFSKEDIADIRMAVEKHF